MTSTQINWAAVGAIGLPFFRIVPPVTFMYGPLSAPPKPAKERKEREPMKRTAVAAEEHAEEASLDAQREAQHKETMRRVARVETLLHDLRRVRFSISLFRCQCAQS